MDSVSCPAGGAESGNRPPFRCVCDAQSHVKALISQAACSRTDVLGGQHDYMVAAPWTGSISLSSCRSLPVSPCTYSSDHPLTCSHALCDTRQQQTARSQPVYFFGRPPSSFHSSLVAVLDCSTSNKACRQLLSDQAAPVARHGGASAVSVVQQMQKREKSFGKMFALRFGMYEWCVYCISCVLWQVIEDDGSRSDLLSL